MSDLAFFDCNCYIGKTAKPAPLAFSSAEALLEDMDYYRIEQAVVTHAAARDYAPAVGNAAVLTELAGHERLLPCWVVPAHADPLGRPAAEVVAEMLARGVRVARMFPPSPAPYSLDAWARSDYFAALEAHRIPLLLTRSDLARHPDDMTQGFSADNIYVLCKAFPHLPIIIVRFNYTYTRIAFALLRECPNLYLELSYFTIHRGVELFTRSFGAERLIFGTGTPVNNPGTALMLVRYANISDEERRLIAGDNLRRLLSEVR
jgi:predicted TIM-barrel fold metal-dependent hydrolase